MSKTDRHPLILAIDTSCDDTAAAVTCGNEIWSNIIASQTELHKPYGGVFPTVAKQAHKENIAPTVETALRRAGVNWEEIDAIAVTQGPGLAPALEVGIAYANKLAQEHQLPLLPINHLEGHLLSVLAVGRSRTSKLEKKRPAHRANSGNSANSTNSAKQPAFPLLGMIISGGHSEFILVNGIGNYTRLGGTLDDAAGEALDKVGRMIDLGYPAGSVIETFAKKGNPRAHDFPLPMTTSGDFNLSFSGIKTFSRNLISQLEAANQLNSKQSIFDFAASLQYGVFRHITYKLAKILEQHPDITEIWLGGGVAANVALRQAIRDTIKKANPSQPQPLKVPYSKRLCQDNAAMIGIAAQFAYNPAQPEQNQLKNTAQPQVLDRKPNLKLA